METRKKRERERERGERKQVLVCLSNRTNTVTDRQIGKCSHANRQVAVKSHHHLRDSRQGKAPSIPSVRRIILPQDSHDRLRRPARVLAQTHRVGEAHLVRDDIRPLQLLEQPRHVAPFRALAMVLVGRHPIVVRLAPLLRDLRLPVRVKAVFVGELGGSLGRVAGALELDQADEAVVVFVAKVRDAAAVATALCDESRAAS
jgi:hypothetical protein